MMETGASVIIKYWTERKEDISLHEWEGIDEFRKEIAESYISVVQARPGELGGLNQLVVEFTSKITLADTVTFLLEGITFDLIKSGAKAFVLRPFLSAYKKLKDRNKNERIDIEEIRVTFQDSVLVIRKITDDSLLPNLENILKTFARHYGALTLASGERPFEIHIPVFEDPTEDRLCRFRVLLDVDETIRDITSSDYVRFWGLGYDYSGAFRVYDVERGLLLDTEFYTLDRYWAEWAERQKEK